MAETRTRGESGEGCCERRTMMSWRKVFGRGAAKGYRFECFLGDDTRTWMWNWRVPGRLASPCKSASRRFMLWMRGKPREHCKVYYDYIRMVEYKNIIQCNENKPGVHLCNIRKRVPRALHPLNVLFFKQCVDRLSCTGERTPNIRHRQTHLFDVRDLGSKPLRDLRDHLLYQRLVLHRLTRLHDADRQVNSL